MDILRRLQNLPEPKRKKILWITVIIIGILLFIFYIKNSQQRLRNLRGEEIKEQFRIPEFQEGLKGLPKIEVPEIEIPEIPEISEKEWEKMKEELSEEEIKMLEEMMEKEE